MDMERRHVRLEGSSNFRDIGGYSAACGRRVRWGRLYRSGSLWGLTKQDWTWMGRHGFSVICDLRSDAEREIAPTSWQGGAGPKEVDAIYDAHLLFGARSAERHANIGAIHGDLYVRFARILAPSLKGLFEALLAGHGPAIVHCTAGQDRTGLAIGLLLEALGVARETIYADYLVSPDLRRPEYEIDRESLAVLADKNVVAKFYSDLLARHGPEVFTPKQLVDENSKPLLAIAFSAIEREFGSIENYFDVALGIGPGQRRDLQDELLERV